MSSRTWRSRMRDLTWAGSTCAAAKASSHAHASVPQLTCCIGGPRRRKVPPRAIALVGMTSSLMTSSLASSQSRQRLPHHCRAFCDKVEILIWITDYRAIRPPSSRGDSRLVCTLSFLPALRIAAAVHARNYHNAIFLNVKEDSVGKSPHASAAQSSVDDRKQPWILCDCLDCFHHRLCETIAQLRAYQVRASIRSASAAGVQTTGTFTAS